MGTTPPPPRPTGVQPRTPWPRDSTPPPIEQARDDVSPALLLFAAGMLTGAGMLWLWLASQAHC